MGALLATSADASSLVSQILSQTDENGDTFKDTRWPRLVRKRPGWA